MGRGRSGAATNKTSRGTKVKMHKQLQLTDSFKERRPNTKRAARIEQQKKEALLVEAKKAKADSESILIKEIKTSDEIPKVKVASVKESKLPHLDNEAFRTYAMEIIRSKKAEPVHYTEDIIQQILKHFDLSSQYGPAIGMTRLERWNRASRLGLDPPQEIHAILTTVEGTQTSSIRDCLFELEL